MSDGNHCIPSDPENPKVPRDPHGFTPTEALVRALIEQSLRRLRRIHNLLLRARRRLPPTPPGELRAMERHQIPFSVSALTLIREPIDPANAAALRQLAASVLDWLQDLRSQALSQA